MKLSEGKIAQRRYAVPDFVGATPDAVEAGKTIAAVLFADLDFEREVYLIPRDTLRVDSRDTRRSRSPLAPWNELGADELVIRLRAADR